MRNSFVGRGLVYFLQSLTSLCLLLLALSATTASASTIVADGVSCTLAQAITAANTNASVGGCLAGDDRNNGGDIIKLTADAILTFPDNVDLAGCGNGLPAISSNISIKGNQHAIARAADAPSFRIIDSRAGILTLEDVSVTNGYLPSQCIGGGVVGAVVTIIHSTVSQNSARHDDPDLVGSSAGGIVATSLTLIRSTVSDNLGGGIFVHGSAFVSLSTVTRNALGGLCWCVGGGLRITGTALIENSTISDNTAGGEAGLGGGLYVDGTITFTNSTISGNYATGRYGLGGGLFLWNGAATFINSTVSGNTAHTGPVDWMAGGSGGGIFGAPPRSPSEGPGPGGPITLIHSTIVGNTADGPYSPGPPSFNEVGGTGGGVSSYSLTVTNSIIANNVASNSTAVDCAAIDVHYTGMSLIGDGTCGAVSSGQLTGDPMIGPLADYGGSAPIHPLLPGSPAIDRIAFTVGAGCEGTDVTADQRGVPRPQPARGGKCDIGAIEFTGFPTNSVLDDFNRDDGKVGPNWTGASNLSAYRIVDGETRVRDGGPMYWTPAVLGRDQEAYLTLTKIDPNGREHDLLLKVQGDPANYTLGEIEVLYDARGHVVRVETLLPGRSTWTIYQDIPVTFEDGDQFGGRVYASGKVEIYRNNVLLDTVTLTSRDQRFFNQLGGRIGVWFQAAPKAVFDSFGGGTVPR